MKLLLVVPSFLLTLLLVVHAVRVRGRRTAFFFFAAALLFGIVRGNSVAALAAGENRGPYIFSEAAVSIGRAELPACVGWVFALYLSWCLAEAVTARAGSLAGRVFPTSSFSLIAMGCFSYAVETAASGVGWWRWNIVRRPTPFLVGGTHLFGIVEWMSVGLDFLLPFLLFRTPKGWRYAPAWLSLGLYPLHWASHWRPQTWPGFPHAYEIYHAAIVLAALAFPLLRSPRLSPAAWRAAPPWIHALPAAAILGMFAVLGWAEVAILRQGSLLLSILPLAALLSLSRGSARSGTVISLAFGALTFAVSWAAGSTPGTALARSLPPLVPLAAVLAWSDRLGLAERPRRRRLVAGGLALLTLAGALGMIQGKRERERYSRLMDRARALTDLGDAAGAEAALKQAIALKPEITLAPKYLANLYGGQGRHEEALEVLRRCLDLDPTDAEAQQIAGSLLRARSRCAEAVPFFERASRLNPSDPEPARDLADCYFKIGKEAAAIQVLRSALARRSGDREAGRLLAAALIRRKEFQEARRIVDEALEADPADAPFHVLKAFIEAGTGNVPAARLECRRALEISPGDPQARRLLESLPSPR
ncbi:MAG TPA: tetratricopeptide repeat protein [Candidatus Polarisedimenticolia bacterium]|nr:tetratricopeptide repeat protein [Candidatus Polarisedimenticolia bacterium]